jgi:hypothetical protein
MSSLRDLILDRVVFLESQHPFGIMTPSYDFIDFLWGQNLSGLILFLEQDQPLR